MGDLFCALRRLFRPTTSKEARAAISRYIDTLILVGNGFDIWQGVSTSYSDFEKYYLEHLPAILKRLHIEPWEIADKSNADSDYYELSPDQQIILDKAAVRSRFFMEQGTRNSQYEFEFLEMMREIAEDFPKITKKDRKKFKKRLKNVGGKDCQDVIKDVLKDRKK